MKSYISLLIFLIPFLVACNSTAVKPDRSLTTSSVTAKTTETKTVTLPDGQTITGSILNYPDGSYYVGDLMNKLPHGKGAFFSKINTITTGQFIDGKPDGLQKFFNMLNGIVSYSIIKDGKVLKTYGELDVLLASGDYEAAYKKRGNKIFLGMGVKKEEGISGIIAHYIIHNSPSDIAGFISGDTVLDINSVSTEEDTVQIFLLRLINLTFGKKVSFRIIRDGKLINIRFVPGIVPKNYPGAESTASLLWQSIKHKNTTMLYQKYLNTVTDITYHAQAKTSFNTIMKKEKAALASQKSRSFMGVAVFCKQYPNSIFLSTELPMLFKKIESNGSFIKQYSLIIKQCATAKKYQPAYYSLLEVGPKGMKVKDALKFISNGTGAELIATKIKFSRQEYRDFNFDELAHLSKFGLHDSIVSAMLESTYKKEQKTAEEYKKRADQLILENKRLKNESNRQKQVTVSTSQQVGEKNMPVECLKLVAALKVCDQSSGFLSMGCKVVAKSSFECPLPLDLLL